MPKPVKGELGDEAVHLTQKGLYVEPLNYPIDMNKFPRNGHEYIHMVRQEHAAIFPEETQVFEMITAEEIHQNTKNIYKINLNEWKNREATFFSHLAIQLKLERSHLLQKFPQKQSPGVREERSCCLFCLGSEIYKKIFVGEAVENVSGNSPYLSIVLHLDQEEILTILRYMCEWSAIVGMNHEICRWMYALLACLWKPVSEECETFLEEFYDTSLKRIKKCDESEKNQLHFISNIIKCYFCIKAYKVDTPLSRFQRLLH